MAFKFALLAALCVAQAFAFPSASELVGDDIARAVGNKDLKIVFRCFAQQERNIEQMSDKVAGVARTVIDGVDEEIREAVAEALKQTEEPVARIAVALKETHRSIYIYLNRLNMNKAFETLVSGVHTIEGLVSGIRTNLNQVKVAKPELSKAMDWYMRYLSFAMEVMIPKMRRDYGACLFRGRPDVLD